MCCRKNTGNNKSTYHTLLTKLCGNRKAATLLWRLLLGNVLIMSALCWQGCYSARDTPPWFGRGRNLPKAPITVLTGTIDLSRGLVGVLELGKNRKQVETVLGKPLVEAMPREEALQRGIDSEDVMNELYGGVFAWVQYNYKDEVISIEFTPRALKERMGLAQRLLVYMGDRVMVLSPQTHRRDVESFVRGLRVKEVRDYGHYMVLEFEKSLCAIYFDHDENFETLSISSL